MPFHYILPEDPPTFPVFVRAVAHHWVVLMSGCASIVALSVLERLSGSNIPLWAYVAVLLLFIFVACFLAWTDARQEMDKLSVELSKKEQILLDKEQNIIELRSELLAEKEKRTPKLEVKLGWFAVGVASNGIKKWSL